MEIKLIKRWKKLILLTLLFLSLPLYVVTTNLYLSIQRGDQKRNLADTRAIGTAVEAYAVDHQIYPPGNSTVAEISHFIEPLYIKGVPKKDSWGNLFLYQTSAMASRTQLPVMEKTINLIRQVITKGLSPDLLTT